MINIYQKTLSPNHGVFPRQRFSSCRFYPTCSRYCEQAIEKYGAAKGVWMSARRILRCHPWNEGGYDPL